LRRQSSSKPMSW